MAQPGATGVHDVGGLDVHEPLDLTDKSYSYWEKQTHAIMLCLVRKGLLTVDELRRNIEALTPQAYEVSR